MNATQIEAADHTPADTTTRYDLYQDGGISFADISNNIYYLRPLANGCYTVTLRQHNRDPITQDVCLADKNSQARFAAGVDDHHGQQIVRRELAVLIDVVNQGKLPESPDWEPPQPLGESDDPLPFPVDALPRTLRNMVTAIAETKQVPPDLPVMFIMTAVFASCALKYEVNVWGDWTERLNNFSAAVLEPSERKSAVEFEVKRPLLAFEEKLRRDAAPVIAQTKADRKILEGQLDQAIRDASGQSKGKAGDKGDAQLAGRGDKDSLASELSRHIVPPAPYILFDDSTPESLAGMLADHGRIATITSEGGIFDMMTGMYSKNGVANISVYLKGYSGDSIRTSRTGRAWEDAPKPALTIGVAVQPIVIEGMIANRQLRGRGIASRFDYYPPTMAGKRAQRREGIPDDVRNECERLVTKLLSISHPYENEGQTPILTKTIGHGDEKFTVPVGQAWETTTLAFGDEAIEEFSRFERMIESRMGEFGDLGHMGDWAGKVAGKVARWAGAFHIVTAIEAGTTPGEIISGELVRNACKVGEYLVVHAKRVYGLMGSDPDTANATYVWRWIKERPEYCLIESTGESFILSQRDIHQSLRRKFKKSGDLDRPLAILVDHAYLRRLDPPPRPVDRSGKPRGGCPPTSEFLVNPIPRTQNPINPQNLGHEWGFEDSEDFEYTPRSLDTSDQAVSVARTQNPQNLSQSVPNGAVNLDLWDEPPPVDEADWDRLLNEGEGFTESEDESGWKVANAS